MRIFDLLTLLNPNSEFTPSNIKIHLATWNGEENPVDVYLEGRFDVWQRWQSRKNFERKFVISFISLPSVNRWLFVGVHHSSAAKWIEKDKCYYYDLVEDQSCAEMNGRIVASFSRTGRQSYLNAENWIEQITLSEILAERLVIGKFPGFKAINLTKAELDLIVRQSSESWYTALSNVAGIYLISDTESGKLYVGSASGEGGIWQRWESYAANGHGGNIELRNLLSSVSGVERSKHFRYSILEIADTHASREEILRRESHWKDVLLYRSHGLNAN